MHPALIVLVFVVGGVVLLIAVIAFAHWVSRRSLRRLESDVDLTGAILTAPAVMPGGQRSAGATVGGVGMLSVHPLELRFLRATPRRTLTIPRCEIVAATIERSLRVPGRYRRNGRPFLVVRWTDSGTERVVGFQPRDPEAVLAALQSPAP